MTQEEKHQSEENVNTADMPTKEQRDVLESSVKKLLNPDGKNPQMDGYVTSTFDYISGMLDKMANSTDKDATAKDIAEDLKVKYENWAGQFKSDTDNAESVEKPESKGKTDSPEIAESGKTGLEKSTGEKETK